jgi:hypothetical protein
VSEKKRGKRREDKLLIDDDRGDPQPRQVAPMYIIATLFQEA